jgi:hypothetical protein
MIRRLIQQQHVRPRQQRPRQQQPRLLTTTDRPQRQLIIQMPDVQPLPHLRQPRLGVPALQNRPPLLHGRELGKHILTGRQAPLEPSHRRDHRSQLTEPLGQKRPDRTVGIRHPLRHITDPRTRSHTDMPLTGRQLTGKQPQQRRLARPVRPDHPDPVTGTQHQIKTGEQQLAIVRMTEPDSFDMHRQDQLQEG